MRIISIVVIFCLVACAARAQHVIKGSITDISGKGLPYATALLQRLPDSSILLTAIADSTGNYKIEVGKLQNGIISASATGYKTEVKTITNVTATVQQIDLALDKENISLNEVAVTAKKPLIERKVDRVIFNIENSITSIGGDALDAIGKAPGVRVSSSDDISLAGKSSVSVMIDDKIIQVSGDELIEMLRAIPASNIARIEVITTPPAKYDAAGNSGMINIVTKKQNKQGFNGSVGMTYMQNSFSSFRPSVSFNYRKNKWNIYGNSNFGDNFSKPVESHVALYPGQRWDQVNSIDNLHNFHYSVLGIDYNVTKKAIIGILYTYAGSTPKRNEDITGKWIGTDNITDSIISTKAYTHDFGERNVVNVNYEWKIDSSGKKLNVDGDFFTRTGRTVRDFATIDRLADGSLTGTNSTDRSTGRQVLYIGSVKADMELPTKFAKVSFGGKASGIHVMSDNVFEYLSGSDYVTDPGKTNRFDYREATQAAYLSAQKKLNKQWDAQAGLRAEYTQTRAASLTMNQVTERKYMQLFPTGYVQYTIDDNNVFNLNYSRRIDRPSMSMINPFRVYMTPNSYSAGNPFLQPSFTSNLELSYTLRSAYTFSIYTQQIQQVSSQVLQIDTAGKGYHFAYANIGTSSNYGFNASASVTPAKWWECNTQLYGFRSQVNASYYNSALPNQYAQTGFIVENDNTFTLNSKKTLVAECGFGYGSVRIENYDYHYPNYNINAGIRALFFNRDLSIGANVNDIFRTEIIKVKNLYNNSVTNNYYDARMLHFSLSYKFGNKNVKDKRTRNSTLEESKRS